MFFSLTTELREAHKPLWMGYARPTSNGRSKELPSKTLLVAVKVFSSRVSAEGQLDWARR
jgi:hypothetical protein